MSTQNEVVGRKYEQVRFGVHSRLKIEPRGNWYGWSNYTTQEEAQAAIQNVSKPICGGMVSIEGGKREYEYRIVKIVSQCEVVHVEDRMV